MKETLATLASALLAASLVLGGCAAGGGAADDSVAAARTDDTPVQGREAILTVYGMSCPLCANNVDKSLLEVPGVTAVDVDMSTGRARVTLDGKTPVTRGQLARAVDNSGFTLRSVQAP